MITTIIIKAIYVTASTAAPKRTPNARAINAAIILAYPVTAIATTQAWSLCGVRSSASSYTFASVAAFTWHPPVRTARSFPSSEPGSHEHFRSVKKWIPSQPLLQK